MSTVFIGLFGFLLTALGFFFAFIPWLVVPSRAFTVPVPIGAQKNPEIVDLKRRYRNILVIATALLLGGFLNVAFPLYPTLWTLSSGFQTFVAVFAIIDVIILICIAWGLTARYRDSIQKLKADYRWEGSEETNEPKEAMEIIQRPSGPIPVANLTENSVRALIIGFCVLLIAFFVFWFFVI